MLQINICHITFHTWKYPNLSLFCKPMYRSCKLLSTAYQGSKFDSVSIMYLVKSKATV